MLEERISRHLHLVEVHPLAEPGQAKRLVVRHEVDLVAPLREDEPQLRGDGARAPVGRIARDADLHRASSGAGPRSVAVAPLRSAKAARTRPTGSTNGAMHSIRQATPGCS